MKKLAVFTLLTAALSACASRVPSSHNEWVQKSEVVDVVNKLFRYTDEKQWDKLTSDIFTESVQLDMSSLTKEPEAQVLAKDLVANWKKNLTPITAIQHQVGNYEVTLTMDGAEVLCYGNATHYRAKDAKKITAFVGSYKIGLLAENGGWKINRFRFNAKYVD